jgi:hypothetical protein
VRRCENEDYIHIDDHRDLFVSLEKIIENLNEEAKDLWHDLKYYEDVIDSMWTLLLDAQGHVHPDNALYGDIDYFYESHKHGLAGVINKKQKA